MHKHVKDFIIGRASMTYDARGLARFSQCPGGRDSFRWSRIDRSAIASLEMSRLIRENAPTLAWASVGTFARRLNDQICYTLTEISIILFI